MSENRGKKGKLKEIEGIAHIKATFNNTLVVITNRAGDKMSQESAGKHFKGSRRSTPFAGELAGRGAGEFAINNFGMKRIIVKVRGPGAGREAAIKGLRASGLVVIQIKDVTRLPTNGCRPKKKRRV